MRTISNHLILHMNTQTHTTSPPTREPKTKNVCTRANQLNIKNISVANKNKMLAGPNCHLALEAAATTCANLTDRQRHTNKQTNKNLTQNKTNTVTN